MLIIENPYFNLFVTIISVLANLVTIISVFKNPSQNNYYYENISINNNSIFNNTYIDRENISINSNSTFNNTYIDSENKKTRDNIIYWIFIFLILLIFVYNMKVLSDFSFTQTGSFFPNIRINISNFLTILLVGVNNSIFIVSILIIIFYISRFIILIKLKEYYKSLLFIFFVISFMILSYNIYCFKVTNSEFITSAVPLLLFVYLIALYCMYIYFFINKNYNPELIKHKIYIYFFYFLNLLSILINLKFL